jgi:hypothetical protein
VGAVLARRGQESRGCCRDDRVAVSTWSWLPALRLSRPGFERASKRFGAGPVIRFRARSRRSDRTLCPRGLMLSGVQSTSASTTVSTDLTEGSAASRVSASSRKCPAIVHNGDVTASRTVRCPCSSMFQPRTSPMSTRLSGAPAATLHGSCTPARTAAISWSNGVLTWHTYARELAIACPKAPTAPRR